MNNYRKYKKVNFPIIFLLGILLINAEFIPFVESNSYFTHGLERGTQILIINQYNEQAWQNTVSSSIKPNNWFGGEANKVGAKSKITTLDYVNRNITPDIIFTHLVFTDETLQLFSNVSNYGYGSYYIYQNYQLHSVWKYYIINWNFTTSEFSIFQKRCIGYRCSSFIVQNPHDYMKIVEDYNDYAGKINNDTTLQSLGITFPIMDGDDLVWQHIIRRFAVAIPINDYLTTMTEALDCKNTTVRDNTLKLKRRGIENYTIEVTYNKYGTVDNLTLKNSEDDVIFNIISFYPTNLFYLILVILILFTLGIVIFVFLIKRKRLKAHKALLERIKSKR